MVSPATVTETIAGEVDAEAGAGHDDEALPEGVQVRATGLLAGGPLVAGCPVAPPQPQTTARATVSMSRRIFFL
ncbi:MAG TPA: hypothetical protein VN961_10790 [Streptosporangiaceae bacterium]|nr:hypothetical protein [Streptosporangiaceae bacterium]